MGSQRMSQSNTSDILLADMNNNAGGDLTNFQKSLGIPGHLIFADLPAIFDKANEVLDDVEGIGYYFFQSHSMALKGAKAYYLFSTLHDWP
ncbi:hypothetical protein CC78DRAFT_574898 [Lojkania enalia]|uniref:O-methyltransferase domain-containing protein n=1 Tax=Lojkania enalia TaxID=147567 RepID=A0A9P4N9X5_9PLEO|nr:hypothetical protein CC78DRAFT_574898 [Didymosphaeria enalia]